MPTNKATSLVIAVRRSLTQLKYEAEAVSSHTLPPERERELSRIQARIEDLQGQFAMIGG
jgi:hypothetical protein